MNNNYLSGETMNIWQTEMAEFVFQYLESELSFNFISNSR